MSDYANDRADNHKRMMQSNRKSVSEFLLTDAEMIEIDNALKDRPLETKARVNQQRSDKIRHTLNGAAIAIITLTIYMIFWR